jgi:alkanesulfonate monooxygenase SsuD/methylene tetrahydromethanopterin reductase-like flavin-dependent oxidoreductase (luciferase family)
MLEEALEVYRRTFRPSEHLDRPHAMIAAGVFVADTDAQARYLRSSQMLSFARLRTGRPGKLPLPVENLEDEIPPHVLAQVNEALSVSATGSPETVHRELSALIDRYKPDELIVTGMIHDHAARVRSFQLAADILKDLVSPARQDAPVAC